MAELEKTQEPDKDGAAAAKSVKSELPQVESPSISPADDVPERELEKPAAATHAVTIFKPRAEASPKSASRFTMPRLTMTRRMKRRAMMVASIALAAAFGAMIGAVAANNFGTIAPATDTAGLEETQAMGKTVAHLTREIAALKIGIDTAAKTTVTQIGKIADRVDKYERTETTASITKVAAAAAAPLPPVRPPIVQGWTARTSRGGVILVEGRGEIYQVSLGVPLPGLGPVESIQRDGDRWVVATPKGIIVSSNTPPPRPRPYYPPPFYRPY
jgi:hypothetical protein